MKAKHEGRTSGKDRQDGNIDMLEITETSEFEQGRVSRRLRLHSCTAAERANVRTSRQVQAKTEQDRLQISDEDKKGTAGNDEGQKKCRSSSLKSGERLRDPLTKQDRTSKPDSKKPKRSSAMKKGKSENAKTDKGSEEREAGKPNSCEFFLLHSISI